MSGNTTTSISWDSVIQDESSHLSWPRWVPDWCRVLDFDDPPPHPISTEAHHPESSSVQASGAFVNGICFAPQEVSTPSLLALSGVLLEEVCTQFVLSVAFDAVWREDMAAQTCSLNQLSQLQAFLHTAACTAKKISSSTLNDLGCALGANEIALSGDRVTERLFRTIPHTRHRSFFWLGSPTAQNPSLLGLGPRPQNMEIEIWMCKGGKSLYMLGPTVYSETTESEVLDLTGGPNGWRTVQRGDVVYQYLGECYMLGLMHGELIDIMQQMPEDRPWPLKDMDSEFRTICLV